MSQLQGRTLLVGLTLVSLVAACASSKSAGGFGAEVNQHDGGEEEEEAPPKKKTSPAPTPKTDGSVETPTPTPAEDAGPVVVADGGKPEGGSGACNAMGVDLSLRAKGKVEVKNLSFSRPELLPPFTAVSACPVSSSLSTSGDRPFEAIVVQNDTGAPATLSAWAVCDSKGDAFLAFYRGSTVPTTESARRSCAVGTILSNGFTLTLGNGDTHKSPDSNGSNFCPSLLATNNVGIRLESCEKAVVFVHPFNEITSTSATPPSAIKLKLD